MRSIFAKFEKIFAAAAFAEAGEHETAREIAGFPPPTSTTSLSEKLDSLMLAVTFAEANCHETALEYLSRSKGSKPEAKSSFAEAVGLQGIRIWYGVAELA